MTAIGQTYHRLVMPYKKPPFVLANLVNPLIDSAEKHKLAQSFLTLPKCCCCMAFCSPLRDLVDNIPDLLDGIGAKALKSLASTKVTNIEVENNFARAHSSKLTGRGRNEFVQSMAAKHLLSEIKLQHLKSIRRAPANGQSVSPSMSPLPLEATDPVKDEEPTEHTELAAFDPAAYLQMARADSYLSTFPLGWLVRRLTWCCPLN